MEQCTQHMTHHIIEGKQERMKATDASGAASAHWLAVAVYSQ